MVNAKREAPGDLQKAGRGSADIRRHGRAKVRQRSYFGTREYAFLTAGRSTFAWFGVIAFLSAAISVGVAIAINFFDPTIQDESYLEEEFGLRYWQQFSITTRSRPAYFISKT